MFTRLKAVLIAGMALGGAVLTTPTISNAAPVSSGWNAAAQRGGGVNADLFSEVRYGRGRGFHGGYGRGRGYGRRFHGGRGYGRRFHGGRGYGYGRRYHGGPRFRRAGFYRPVRYGRPVRCRIAYQQVWNGWGYVSQPVRVCRRW